MAKRTPEQMYEEAERAAIGDAIADTEQEIYDDALNLDPADNDGDRSLEEIDGDDVLDDDEIEGESEAEETGEAEGEETGEGEAEEPPPQTRQDDRPGRGVPPARLREEADARRVAEAEARELRARLDALEARQRQPQPRQEEQRQPEVPDMFADPEGWARHQEAKITQQFEERRINASFADAEDSHGDAFRTAFADLQKTGNSNLVREIVGSHNPGKTLMRWHERQALQAEIGNDPAAYRERVRQELLQDPEIRKAVISGARTDATSNGRTQTRLPPSLNSASGGTSHRGGSRSSARNMRSEEQDIFASAFED
jgi:hypothetical protein